LPTPGTERTLPGEFKEENAAGLPGRIFVMIKVLFCPCTILNHFGSFPAACGGGLHLPIDFGGSKIENVC
jgi:hypothetical protein